METKQALELLKQLLDRSVKAGLFENAESVLALTEAYNTIAKQFAEPNEQP